VAPYATSANWELDLRSSKSALWCLKKWMTSSGWMSMGCCVYVVEFGDLVIILGRWRGWPIFLELRPIVTMWRGWGGGRAIKAVRLNVWVEKVFLWIEIFDTRGNTEPSGDLSRISKFLNIEVEGASDLRRLVQTSWGIFQSLVWFSVERPHRQRQSFHNRISTEINDCLSLNFKIILQE
jgi:hypothetical protein